MRPKLERQASNIVLRGQFNPAIFHPSWFAAQDLILDQEAEAAEIQIVHPEAAIFQVDWLQIHVIRDRFQATATQKPYYEALRDLVVGTFDLLRHTPLRVLGINRDFHYRLESEEAWHAVGHRLAPKQDWENLLLQPGMTSLTMEGQRPDNLDGYIHVKVGPSAEARFGVYVNINDHYQPATTKDATGAREIIDILSQQWEESMARSEGIAHEIARLGDPL